MSIASKVSAFLVGALAIAAAAAAASFVPAYKASGVNPVNALRAE